MKLRVISENKRRGTVMITIVHDGRSYTRHCKRAPGGFVGHLLDRERAILQIKQAASEVICAHLKMGGISVSPYVPHLLVTYPDSSDSEEIIAAYRKHLEAEDRRALEVGKRMEEAQAIVELRQEEARRRAQEAARPKAIAAESER